MLFLQDRKDKRSVQYETNLNERQAIIDSIKHEIEESKISFEEKVDELNRSIEKTQHRNFEIISSREKEYADELDEAKKQYASRLESVDEEIAAVQSDIDDINKEISILNKQADDYNSGYEASKASLLQQNSQSLAIMNEEKERLEARMKQLQDEFLKAEETRKNNAHDIENMIRTLVARKEELLEAEREARRLR